MSKHTGPEPARELHPTWCRQPGDDCGPTVSSEAMHKGHPERLEFAEHATDGTEFAVEARRYFLESPDLAQFPHDYGFQLSFEGLEMGHAALNPDRMRDLADWLFTEADRLDHWRELRNQEACND